MMPFASMTKRSGENNLGPTSNVLSVERRYGLTGMAAMRLHTSSTTNEMVHVR